MRKVGLINVAGRNVVLAAADTSRVGVTRLTGDKARLYGAGRGRVRPGYARQASFQLRQSVTAFPEQFFPRFSPKS